MSQLRVPISGRDHLRGPEDAPLIFVEYGDYQCPFCAEAEGGLRVLEQELAENLKRVYRHFPLTQVHEHAFAAAMSAEAAGAQGKFWEMHELLFANQAILGPDRFEEFAAALGLDLEEFRRGQHNPAFSARIKQDFMSGVRSGVNGTPGFFLNGEKYEGPLDADFLIELLRSA